MDNSNFNLFIDVSKFSNKYDNECVFKNNELLKKIPFNIKQNNVNINIIGDKGYITNEKFKIFNKEVKIITPLRKNNQCLSKAQTDYNF